MPKLLRILTMDGGGMRGIIPGEILITLEEMLQERSRNPLAKLGDYFDFIAGTSTGGIAVTLLLCPDPDDPQRPRYTAREVGDLLIKGGSEIFNIPFWQQLRSLGGLTDERYPVEPMRRILTDYLGEIKLSDLVKPCLVTAYDMQRRRTYFFTQYNARADRQRDFLARDVGLATSAAPTFFEVAHIQSLTGDYSSMIDGGVFASNPAMCAYVEAQRFQGHPTAKQMLLLSLGTGQVTTPYDFKRIQHWGIFDWLKPLLDMFMTGVSETVDFQLRQIFAAAGVPHQYLRMNPFLDGSCSPELDNATPENLKNLQIAGQGAARDQARDLGRFADLLVRIGPKVAPPKFPATRRRTS